jgi:predicted porin
VSLGRQNAATIDALAPFAAAMLAYGPSYLTTHPGDLDRTLNIPIDNSIKYTSPTFAGLTAIGLYGVGGTPGSLRTNSTRNVALTFAQGPVTLGASWLRIFGSNVTNSALFDASANPLGPTGPDDSYQSIGVGGSYKADAFFVHGLVTQSRFDTAQAQARSYELGTMYSLSPALKLGADYNYTNVRGRAHTNLGALSIDYFLSKRTDLYAVTAYERASGRNASGGPLSAQLFTFASSSSGNQLAVHLGLRHKF